jgi:phospholipid/cholesterol/gamma-HCH transport system permease protein
MIFCVFTMFLQSLKFQAILGSMMNDTNMHDPNIQYDAKAQQIICSGNWDLANITNLQFAMAALSLPAPSSLSAEITIDGQAAKLDSAGAWLVLQLQNQIQKQGLKVERVNFSKEANKLIDMVKNKLGESIEAPSPEKPNLLARIGFNSIMQLREFQSYLAFVGQLTLEAFRLITQPLQWRWNALASAIYSTGYQALPIIALLSFLIGVVLTYQMGLQLRNYGANIFIVDLLGLSVLREFAPLITAIMVAGRTGSAFTASLGMMKLNQEIDALNTLGVTPAELLILPRVLGLFIALPLLTMWSDIFGILGGMVMSNNMLGISWYDFLHRFQQTVPLRSFIIGIGKAPIFALIIASVGCYQGMQVKNNAASLGQNTTKSVVLAIFFIIVADAAFSIILSKMHL